MVCNYPVFPTNLVSGVMQVFAFPAQDLVGDLKEKLSNHFKDVMVGLMYPPPSYDAHELWHAMKVERATL